MANTDNVRSVEDQIAQWRGYLSRRQAIQAKDVAELEDHLREHITALSAAGLSADEAFLVAVKRMGDLDSVSREFAREHSERLWKQLVVSGAEQDANAAEARKDGLVALGIAIGAGALVKLPAFLGFSMEEHEHWYVRNASLFVLPLLTVYFVWKRQIAATTARWLALPFIVAAVLVNAPTFTPGGPVEILTVLHLPIALWLAIGIAYTGGRWSESSSRMDFIRFSGELFIYFVLIALGGGLLMGFTGMIFQAIGINIEKLFGTWIVPCGAAGGLIIASWLVEAKKGVIENMAPVLTRLFTPLFTLALLAFLGTMLFTGRGVNMERDALIAFDAVLAVVLALLLYSISARDFDAPAGLFDIMQVVLVISALIANTVALWAIGTRISEFGFTPNRVAALGENVILLVNLSVSAVLYIRFLRGRESFARVEKWQTGYLPVYAGWAAIVVIVFPFLFGR